MPSLKGLAHDKRSGLFSRSFSDVEKTSSITSLTPEGPEIKIKIKTEIAKLLLFQLIRLRLRYFDGATPFSITTLRLMTCCIMTLSTTKKLILDDIAECHN